MGFTLPVLRDSCFGRWLITYHCQTAEDGNGPLDPLDGESGAARGLVWVPWHTLPSRCVYASNFRRQCFSFSFGSFVIITPGVGHPITRFGPVW